jgi:predicted nucleic acid-binding protein
MYYVDTNVFIYPIIYDETERKALNAKNILIKIAEGSLECITASLTWDELTWIIRKTLGVKIAIEEGRRFLKFPNLKIVSVDEKIIREAQKIVEKYKVKPRDAIHASCAVKNKVKEIISDDPDFDKIKEIRRIELDRI